MALARAQTRFIQQHPALWQMLFRYSLPEGQTLPDWYRARIAETIRELELALAPAFGADQAACRRHARMLWAAFYGLCEVASLGKLKLIGLGEVEGMTRELVGASLADLQKGRSR
mgnify:CR=1 FL=1